jgi:hypothetical protein
MKIVAIIVAGLVGGTMAATPILAQTGEACFQHNRMQSWKAINEHVIDFTDIQRHHYTITMTHDCRGITDPQAHLVFHTWQNLQCLPAGEIVIVTTPLFGATQCSVASVQPNLPFLPGYGASG